MSTLHLINQSPFINNRLNNCIRFAHSKSSILFLEEGVYATLINTSYMEVIEGLIKNHRLYTLEEDLIARGVKERVIKGINLINYAGFVDLVVQHSTIHTWL